MDHDDTTKKGDSSRQSHQEDKQQDKENPQPGPSGCPPRSPKKSSVNSAIRSANDAILRRKNYTKVKKAMYDAVGLPYPSEMKKKDESELEALREAKNELLYSVRKVEDTAAWVKGHANICPREELS